MVSGSVYVGQREHVCVWKHGSFVCAQQNEQTMFESAASGLPLRKKNTTGWITRNDSWILNPFSYWNHEKSTWQHYCITHHKISAARYKNKAIIWHLWQTRVTSEDRRTPPLHSLSGKSFIRREISDSVKIKSFSCSWSQQDSQVALSVTRPSYSLISPCLLPASCIRLLTGRGVPDTGATSGQLSMTMFVLSSNIKHTQKKESSKRSRLL